MPGRNWKNVTAVVALLTTIPLAGYFLPKTSPKLEHQESENIDALFTEAIVRAKIREDAATQMQQITNQVAENVVKQYEIANRHGTPIDICVQAGLVSAAYLQAQDEPNYQKWKEREIADCDRAGIQK